MKPYYDQGGIQIYHGKCEAVMPTLHDSAFDLVLTDPPYGMNYESNHYKHGNPHKAIAGDNAFPVAVLENLIKCAKTGVLAFCRWDNLESFPKPKSFIVWEKNNHTAGDLEHEYARQWEACAWWPGSAHRWAKGRPQDIIKCDRVAPGSLLHPTQKPVELMGMLISQNACEVVLDPYMGSGTTLRAAKDLNLKAIGIEVEERYCEIAAKRLQQEVFSFD